MSIERHRPKGTLPSFVLGTSTVPWAGAGLWRTTLANTRTDFRFARMLRDSLTDCRYRHAASDS